MKLNVKTSIFENTFADFFFYIFCQGFPIDDGGVSVYTSGACQAAGRLGERWEMGGWGD